MYKKCLSCRYFDKQESTTFKNCYHPEKCPIYQSSGKVAYIFEDFYLRIQLLSEDAKMPTRATDGDAGLDLYSPYDYEILAGSDILIPLDIRVEFPKGYALIVKEKSGVATKLKLDIGAAVIDSGYRGNCHVHLFNNNPINCLTTIIEKHQKIAQMVVMPVWVGQPLQVDNISTDTERGKGGFGSTGK